jgi:S-adenosylmethionine-dependent methyltransferase
MKPIAKGENRFQSDARRYAQYLETPEGRLRTDITFANLEEFLPVPRTGSSVRVLDIGCGTALASSQLASRGAEVTLLDSSQAMLELAKKTVLEAGSSGKISFNQGDAAQLASTFPPQSFDLILCHNLLEYVDDPGNVLRGAVSLMRGPSAILSVLARNQAGEVMKAIQAGDLAAAEHNLTAASARESLYGGEVRLFTPDALEAMLDGASLTVAARRGVRVIADYLPPQVSRSQEYDRILALERKLSCRQEFFPAARYLHYVARPGTVPMREG